jgi:hypothetical protein
MGIVVLRLVTKWAQPSGPVRRDGAGPFYLETHCAHSVSGLPSGVQPRVSAQFL